MPAIFLSGHYKFILGEHTKPSFNKSIERFFVLQANGRQFCSLVQESTSTGQGSKTQEEGGK
jgi:hypothetical protein